MTFPLLHPILCASWLSTLPGWERVQTLVLDCPVCKQQFTINVRQDGPADMVRAIWTLKQPPGNSSWAAVSLEPSIQLHPHARQLPACPAHFSITNGQVLMH